MSPASADVLTMTEKVFDCLDPVLDRGQNSLEEYIKVIQAYGWYRTVRKEGEFGPGFKELAKKELMGPVYKAVRAVGEPLALVLLGVQGTLAEYLEEVEGPPQEQQQHMQQAPPNSQSPPASVLLHSSPSTPAPPAATTATTSSTTSPGTGNSSDPAVPPLAAAVANMAPLVGPAIAGVFRGWREQQQGMERNRKAKLKSLRVNVDQALHTLQQTMQQDGPIAGKEADWLRYKWPVWATGVLQGVGAVKLLLDYLGSQQQETVVGLFMQELCSMEAPKNTAQQQEQQQQGVEGGGVVGIEVKAGDGPIQSPPLTPLEERAYMHLVAIWVMQACCCLVRMLVLWLVPQTPNAAVDVGRQGGGWYGDVSVKPALSLNISIGTPRQGSAAGGGVSSSSTWEVCSKGQQAATVEALNLMNRADPVLAAFLRQKDVPLRRDFWVPQPWLQVVALTLDPAYQEYEVAQVARDEAKDKLDKAQAQLKEAKDKLDKANTSSANKPAQEGGRVAQGQGGKEGNTSLLAGIEGSGVLGAPAQGQTAAAVMDKGPVTGIPQLAEQLGVHNRLMRMKKARLIEKWGGGKVVEQYVRAVWRFQKKTPELFKGWKDNRIFYFVDSKLPAAAAAKDGKGYTAAGRQQAAPGAVTGSGLGRSGKELEVEEVGQQQAGGSGSADAGAGSSRSILGAGGFREAGLGTGAAAAAGGGGEASKTAPAASAVGAGALAIPAVGASNDGEAQPASLGTQPSGGDLQSWGSGALLPEESDAATWVCSSSGSGSGGAGWGVPGGPINAPAAARASAASDSQASIFIDRDKEREPMVRGDILVGVAGNMKVRN